MEKIIADAWKLPFREVGIKIVDRDGRQVLDYFWTPEIPLSDFLETLNTDGPGPVSIDPERVLLSKTDVLLDTKMWFRIRGWGYLTGHGACALGLDPEEAVKKQKDLASWILKKICRTP